MFRQSGRNYTYPEPSHNSWGEEEIYENIKPCGSLDDGESCYLNWTINTTGTIGDAYLIDANFTSSHSSITNNDTENAYITITDVTAPNIIWELPTPTDGDTTEQDYAYLNTTITDDSNTSATLDWNYSLVGYWAMDYYNSSGVFDNSTFSNFGDFNGDISTDNITNGKYGSAVEFDGSGDYIQIETNHGLTDKWTVEAWFRILGSSDQGAIVTIPYQSDSPGINGLLPWPISQ